MNGEEEITWPTIDPRQLGTYTYGTARFDAPMYRGRWVMMRESSLAKVVRRLKLILSLSRVHK